MCLLWLITIRIPSIIAGNPAQKEASSEGFSEIHLDCVASSRVGDTWPGDTWPVTWQPRGRHVIGRHVTGHVSPTRVPRDQSGVAHAGATWPVMCCPRAWHAPGHVSPTDLPRQDNHYDLYHSCKKVLPYDLNITREVFTPLVIIQC